MKNYKKYLAYTLVLLFLFTPFMLNAAIVTCGDDKNMCNLNDFFTVLGSLVKWIFGIAAALATIMFAYAGFLYMTAQGNTSQVQKAHDIFKNVVIGFIIMLCAWLIIQLIVNTLGADTKNSILQSVF